MHAIDIASLVYVKTGSSLLQNTLYKGYIPNTDSVYGFIDKGPCWFLLKILHDGKPHKAYTNPFSAKSVMFLPESINTMAADALAPWVARSSIIRMLTIDNKSHCR